MVWFISDTQEVPGATEVRKENPLRKIFVVVEQAGLCRTDCGQDSPGAQEMLLWLGL